MTDWRSASIALFVIALGCGDSDADPPGGGGAGGGAVTGAGGQGGSGEPPNQPPIAVITATPESGSAPLAVALSGSESSDPDGQIVAYAWTIDGDTDAGVELTRTFDVGCHEVELTVTDDDGDTASTSTVVAVASGEPVVPPDVTVEDAPLPSAVLPRDLTTDEGTARFTGVVASDGYTAVRADVLDGEDVVASVSVPLCGAAPATFEIDVPIPSELRAFDVKLFVVGGEVSEEVYGVTDLVAGDIYVVQGQSNAASAQYAGDANENQSAFVRSFGTNTEDGAATASDVAWRMANGNAGGGQGAIGQWPMRMAGRLSTLHETPIGIINGARGGQPIGYFQRNDADTTDLATNYGRLLTRMRNAGLEGSVRAFLWYQGESDGAAFEVHREGFLALKDDWAADYPGVERTYVTQLRAGCGGDLIRTQEVQRKLPDEFPEMTVMSTTGLNGHDGCHYAYEHGYRELGDRYAALLGRDLYGEMPATDVEPPNPASAQFAAGGTQVVLTMRNPDALLTVEPGIGPTFRFEGAAATVTGAAIEDNQLVLTITGSAASATGLTYLGATGTAAWVLNENGIGMLEFFDLPIAPE
jgi:PKD repeat protein